MKKASTYSLLFILFLLSCQSGGEPSAENSSGKKLVSNNGVNIDYAEGGKGDTTILFVHGWAINKSYWHDQYEHLKDHYNVVVIDLPGFGKSGKNRNDWSVAEFGRDVDSVMDQLDLKNVILVGHSMSGDIVLEAALHLPKRVMGIIGIDNFKGFGEVPDSNFKKTYSKIMDTMRMNYSGIVREYFSQQLFSKSTDSATKNRILNDVLHTDSIIAVNVMAAMDYDEIGKAESYHKPIYLINSDYTPTDTLGFKKKGVAFRLFTVHGTGHYPMVEKPAEFNLLLDSAINEIKESAVK